MSVPLLSICIATRNRATFIGQTLESICSQMTSDVEIIIIDGASTDNTSAIVGQYAAKHPLIRYTRLEQNGGPDRDFVRSVDAATGRYVWLMTDDDLLKPGAIDAVLKHVDRGFGLIVVNAEVRDRDMNALIAPTRLTFDGDRVYAEGEDERLFIDVAGYLSFIGGVVMNRDTWMRRDRERYIGTAFPHVGVIFQTDLPGGAIALAQPWISIRYGNALWTPQSFEIWMVLWPRLLWSFDRFSAVARGRVSPRDPWRQVRTLLVYRALGAFTRAHIVKLPARELSTAMRLLLRLIAIVPGMPLNAALLLATRLKGASARILQADLRNSPHYWARGLRRS